jgi:hypothetical protein
MTFTTVFDADQQGYENWWFPALGLVFVAFGLLRLYFPTVLPGPPGSRTSNRTIILFASLWTVVTFFGTAMGSWGAEHRLDQHRHETVEGPVTDYTNNGRSFESFSVDGHRFSYDDNVVTSGFHTTAAHGGPIREGLYVRIAFSGNLILRLEVAQRTNDDQHVVRF